MEKKKKLTANIYIIGFMGAGKSSVCEALGRIYRAEICDTDRTLEKQEGRSVAAIYKEEGRDYFKEAESRLLERLSKRKGLVIACGGETPLSERNRLLMKKGKVVFLRTPEEEILRRVNRRNTRPDLFGKTEEEIRTMIREREAVYEEMADLTVMTLGKNKDDIAKEIMETF